MNFGIGQSVPRTEDPRLLTGSGVFVDDIALPNMTHACVVYSPLAHGEIRTVDTAAALAAPGVLAVLTGDDAKADGLGSIPPLFMPEDMGGPKGYRANRPVIAQGRVRHVGERLAVVVAETREQARDGAELVRLDLDELPVVVRTVDAVADGAPLIHDGAANNKSFTMRFGDAEATDAAMARAHHVARIRLHNNRLTANSMETRGAIGDYSRADDSYTIYTSTQNPHGVRTTLAQAIFHQPESKFRVVARDVGGGFGMKGCIHPEEALVLWASRRVGRPVKWIAERSEAFIGDDQGRDQTLEGELALDEEGYFLALRWRATHAVGAYIAGAACVPLVFSLRLAPSVYAFPALDVMSSLVFTNTAPLSPYRGAGRPEAIYAVERLIDIAARETGLDRIELRRRNFIPPEAMPHETATHFIYDSGEFAATMDKCLELADCDGFEARRRATEAAGKRRGLGISYYIDDNGFLNERMQIRFDPSGSATILAGTFSHGQGHQTVYAQMVADWLGVPFEDIRMEQGDTARIVFGRGTYASRSMTIGGSALRRAADDVIENGKKFAAHLLEADAGDIEFADGVFTVAGTDRSMGLVEVAKAAYRPHGNPIELGVGLEGIGAFDGHHASFPNGCHICEVEIDPETGVVRLDRFAVVDDLGRVLNPLLAEGQIHAGVVQGIGQALLENVHYEPNTGQLLSGSLLDYCLPRADDLPWLETDTHEVPCRTNPIGVKGCGEGGTVGAVPAVISAVLDALAPLGVTDINLPATPERVWRAIQNAAG